MQEMATYKLRFWYWHQEITITGITADELIQSLFFPNSFEMRDFYREVHLEGEGGSYPIAVTINSLEKLSIEHLKREDHESLDTALGDHGRTELSDEFWILEEEESSGKKDEDNRQYEVLT